MSADQSTEQNAEQNSYNKMGMFTFVASMVASLGVLIYVAFLSGGIDLKEVPEAKTAQTVPATNAPTNPAAPAAETTSPGVDQQTAPAGAIQPATNPTATPAATK